MKVKQSRSPKTTLNKASRAARNETQIATTGSGPVADDGLLRLVQIIGRAEVSEKQAAKNRATGKGPRRPKQAMRPIVPIGKSAWWKGIADGRYPQPVKIGGATAWRVSDINALLRRLGSTS